MSMNKPTFSYNNYGVKSSSDMYRNIKGVRFIVFTSDISQLEEVRKIAKEKGLKVRVIQGEIFMEETDEMPENLCKLLYK